jgi:hypothetical protein
MSWLDPTLSLATELQMETDRRRAVRLKLQELQQQSDRLIVQWYTQQHLLNQALRRVACLEVELLLAKAEPSLPGPSERYMEMARELLARNSADL